MPVSSNLIHVNHCIRLIMPLYWVSLCCSKRYRVWCFCISLYCMCSCGTVRLSLGLKTHMNLSLSTSLMLHCVIASYLPSRGVLTWRWTMNWCVGPPRWAAIRCVCQLTREKHHSAALVVVQTICEHHSWHLCPVQSALRSTSFKMGVVSMRTLISPSLSNFISNCVECGGPIKEGRTPIFSGTSCLQCWALK